MFDARTFDEITASILTTQQAEYRNLGLDLSIIPGSRAWMLARGFALNLIGHDAFASNLRREVFPTSASSTMLDEHGRVDGLSREPATRARLTVTGTGTPLSTVNLTNRVLRSSAGVQYTPDVSSAICDVAGVFTVAITASLSGTASNLPASAALSFDSLPPNATTLLATVTSVDVVADDAERDEDYAARITSERRERPGSGNRAQWRAWAQAVSGVSRAYVYPLHSVTYGPNTLGAVTVLCIGPTQGESVIDSRVLPGGTLDNVRGYIEGTNDTEGVAVDGDQLRTLGIGPDYDLIACSTSAQSVDVQIVNAAAYAFPFTSYFARVSSTTTTVVVAGDQSALAGKPVLLFMGISYARGGYLARNVTTAVFSAGNTTLTLDTALPAAPSNDTHGFCVYPRPPNWEAIVSEVLAVFDELGPGDTSPAARWPTEEIDGRATLYPTSISAALVRRTLPDGTTTGVAGVLAATVVDPAAPVVPSAFTIVSLYHLRVRP